MPSKLVTDREKESNAVIASGEANATDVGRDLAKAVRPLLQKGETAPDYQLVIALATRGLAVVVRDMVGADEAHTRQLRLEETPREDRDTAAAALSQRMVDVRGALDGVYGAGTAHKAGFTGNTSEDPVVLKRQADEVIPALRTLALPAPRVKGTSVDVKAVATELEGLRDALGKPLANLALSSRQTQRTLAAKTSAIAAHDDRASTTADLLDCLFRQSGRADIADRIRPPSHRKAGAAEVQDPVPGGVTSPPESAVAAPTTTAGATPVIPFAFPAPAAPAAATGGAKKTRKAKAKAGRGKRKKASRKRA